jgi:hypothetical protein
LIAAFIVALIRIVEAMKLPIALVIQRNVISRLIAFKIVEARFLIREVTTIIPQVADFIKTDAMMICAGKESLAK